MDYLDELGRRIVRHAGSDSRPLWVEGLLVFATDRVTEPMLTLVAQGAKRSVLGDHVFDHRPGKAAVVNTVCADHNL